MAKAGILGTGFYLPERIVTNKEMETIVDTTDEWIRTRTGIEQRHIAADNQPTSDLGVEAGTRALENSGLKKEDIDLIVTATITPDYMWPAAANLIQKKMGFVEIPSFDISAACSGFIYGLTLCKAMVESGQYKNILLIAAEKLSSITDWEDRNTCVLLGDGAGAAVIGESDSSEILSTAMHSDGSKLEMLYQPAGGCVIPPDEKAIKERLCFLKMDGKEVYKQAITRMPEVLEEAMVKADLKPENIDHVIFHQANIRIIESIAKRFGWGEEKNIVNIQKYGNTSAATIPIAFAEAINNKRIKKGDTVAFSAFGAGLTWAAAVVKV